MLRAPLPKTNDDRPPGCGRLARCDVQAGCAAERGGVVCCGSGLAEY